QTNNTIVIGGTISPVSQYNGTQYAMTIYVWKDLQQACWWLQVGGTVVGYWPTNLFSHLNTSSNLLTWGGEVVNLKTNGQHTTTEMGSGHFPSEGFGKASFFNGIQ
ncbi:neprosin family prolyl endopeptidase, partial [Salmonella sp. s58953]|uniref:neprosin family prolyl endopeptidase n=1 Tax=Salmonella sp. s58953 TaxID=3159711 RepID=UPI00397F8641